MSLNHRLGLVWMLVPAVAMGQALDFETLPGGGTPVDDQPLPRSTPYVVDGIEVRIGFDASGDGFADTDALFEAVGDDGTDGYNVCFQENDTARSGLDAQLGSFFLRWVDPVQSLAALPPPLVIDYNLPVQAFSGEIWDLDSFTTFERWHIVAYNGAGDVVADLTSPVTEPGCSGNTFDGEPWIFSVAAVDIRKIIITFDGDASSVGLAFNNFLSNSFLPGPMLIARTPNAAEGVERGHQGVPKVDLIWSEPVRVDPGDVSVVDGSGQAVPFTLSGSGTQITTITFGAGFLLLNDLYTITVADTAVAVANNAPLDGDGNGIAGGALVLPLRHICLADLDTPIGVLDLRDITAFVEEFLNNCQ